MRAHLRELTDLIQFSSPRKLWNMAKLVSSFYVARAMRKPIQWGLPMTVGIEPTTACNLGCPHCPSGLKAFTRPTGRLKLERFQALVDDIGKDIMYLILYFQGEPYINKDFLKMVEYAYQRGIYTMTSTNAHFLDPLTAEQTVKAGLGRLVISMDGVDQATYERYRKGGTLDKVLLGTKNLVEAKRKLKSPRPFIDLQFIAFDYNTHQIPEVKRIGKELGVDRVSIKTAQVYDYENSEGWIPDDERLSRYKKTDEGKYVIKNKLYNHCWKLWHGAEITWDGRVLPCCFDKDADYQMGRFPEDADFRTIWQGEAYRAFRTQLLDSRKNIDICSNCTEGTKVWA